MTYDKRICVPLAESKVRELDEAASALGTSRSGAVRAAIDSLIHEHRRKRDIARKHQCALGFACGQYPDCDFMDMTVHGAVCAALGSAHPSE